MRRLAALLPLLAVVAAPVSAQRLDQAAALVDGQRVGPSVSATSETGTTLRSLFNRNTVRMSHSVEFTASTGFGSVGMYTNSLQWQPSAKVAGRLDVAVANQFGGGALALGGPETSGTRVFVRNAELAYRPTASTELRVQFQQNPYASPYGAYGYGMGGYGMTPYGMGGYGYGQTVRATYGSPDLFFRDR